ncbi:MAG: hypothetical protein ACTH31_06720 [Pseudoclavibacter sp.]
MRLIPSAFVERLRERGLPDAIITIATKAGEAVHPELDFRAEAPWDATWSVVEAVNREDLLPVWACGTTGVYSAGDGTFLSWNAEEAQPWDIYADLTAAVRALLTDFFEDEATDDERREIADLLLPDDQVDLALQLEER